MQRLFVALLLPDEALQACGRETSRLKAALGGWAKSVRFPRSEGLHFTLKFLGPVPDDGVPEISAGLKRAARECTPFHVTLEGLEAFPSPRQPRVICLGISEGKGPMSAAAAVVEKEIAPLGFPADRRGFTPHVTLARVTETRAAEKIGSCFAAMPPERLARFEVRALALMLSELQQAGSRYNTLERFPFGFP
jgi:RNA 2',3'-cyclic 3'-phosphodiesterase